MVTKTLKSFEEVTNEQVFLELTDKQEELLNVILDGKHRRILFGGAVGGAKTVGCLSVLEVLCRIFPGSRWVVVRKDNPTLKRNTLPSFWKFCPKPFFHPSRYNKQEQVATALNGSQIIFMSENFKDDPELTRFDGLEVNGALMEQGEELQEATYLKLVDRIGRWKLLIMPIPFILLSCNPHQGYLKEMFYMPWSEKRLELPYFFLQALPSDNPHLDKEYLEGLEELKKRAPNLYRKRVLGSWEAEDDIQQLIAWESLWGCEKLLKHTRQERKDGLITSLGIDVGRFGRDPSKWYVLEGNLSRGFNIIKKIGYPKTSGPQVEHMTKKLIDEYDIYHDRAWMDVVGLGGPILDHLHKDGYEIQAFNGGSKPIEQFVENEKKDGKNYLFDNLNSQASWNLKILIDEGRIGGIKEEKLRNDLAAYGYDIKGEKKIAVWSKDRVKAKIKRSPDDGDALKYGVWGAIHDTIEPLPGVFSV